MPPKVELVTIIVNIPTIVLISTGLATSNWKENGEFSMGLFQICYGNHSRTGKSGCHKITEELHEYSDVIAGCRYTIVAALCLLFLVTLISVVKLCKRNTKQTKALRVRLAFGFISVAAIVISTLVFWIQVLPMDTPYSQGFSMICVIAGISFKLLELIVYNLIAVCCLTECYPTEVRPDIDKNRKDKEEKENDLSFEIPLKDLAVTEGENIMLRYQITNWNRLKIQKTVWSKDDKGITALTDRAKEELNTRSGTGSLSIPNARRKDTGKYKCEVKFSRNKSISSTCTVTIHPARPTFKTKLENKKLDYGECLKLSCYVEFTETIKWLRDNEEIRTEGNNRISILFANNHASLSITNITMQDAGEYTCIARSWGKDPKESKINCIVEVIGDSAPSFPERPEFVKVLEGRPLTISLKVLGYPRPIVSWYKDNKLLDQGDIIIMKVHVSTGHAELKILQTTKADAGEYKCCAKNQYGNDFITIPVIVEKEVIAECPICQDKVPDVVLPCGHPLCRSCAEEIQRSNSLCPFCQTRFSAPSRLFL